jgi:hypothetical protein
MVVEGRHDAITKPGVRLFVDQRGVAEQIEVVLRITVGVMDEVAPSRSCRSVFESTDVAFAGCDCRAVHGARYTCSIWVKVAANELG